MYDRGYVGRAGHQPCVGKVQVSSSTSRPRACGSKTFKSFHRPVGRLHFHGASSARLCTVLIHPDRPRQPDKSQRCSLL